MDDKINGKTIEQILTAMEKWGGGFIHDLAKLYKRADINNQRKLREAFDNFFTDYSADYFHKEG